MEYHPSSPLVQALKSWLAGISDGDYCEFASSYPDAAHSFAWEIFTLMCELFRVWGLLLMKKR